jgi:hypothetical protein
MTRPFGAGAGVLATPGLSVRLLVGCLIGFYVLLPLDRGFPTIPLFGRPLNSSIAATVCVLGILVFQTRGAVLAYLREPYGVFQSVYACVLFVGALRAPSAPSALHWSLLYYSTFVLNYVILRHVTKHYGTRWLSGVVVGLGVAAAAVGIMQSVIGMPLPVYDTWFENYFRRPPQDYSLATSRATGTMSNPILYGLLMALVVPYALELKNRPARAVALFTIMLAAGLSGSRTAVLVVAVFAGGALLVYRWRAVRALPAVGLGLVLLTATLTWLTPAGQDSRVALLVERLAFMVDPSGVAEKSSTVMIPTPNATAAVRSREAPAPVSAGAPDNASTGRSGDVASTTSAASRDSAPPTGPVTAKTPTDTRGRTEAYAALGVSLRQQAASEATREMTDEWDALTWVFGRGTFTVSAVGIRIQPWYNTVDNVFVSVLYERGLIGLALFVGAFLSILVIARRAATMTVHWFAPVALAAAGFSFCWDAYSVFNILVVGSMTIVMGHVERPSGAADARPAAETTARSRAIDGTSPGPRPSQE